MKNTSSNAQDSEPAGLNISARRAELGIQHWNRQKSDVLANAEGLHLNDEHWEVIKFLRKHYLEQGAPRHARTLSRDLSQHFKAWGGKRYLHRLFAGGPVTQGSRLANLRTPADATDTSFGTSY